MSRALGAHQWRLSENGWTNAASAADTCAVISPLSLIQPSGERVLALSRSRFTRRDGTSKAQLSSLVEVVDWALDATSRLNLVDRCADRLERDDEGAAYAIATWTAWPLGARVMGAPTSGILDLASISATRDRSAYPGEARDDDPEMRDIDDDAVDDAKLDSEQQVTLSDDEGPSGEAIGETAPENLSGPGAPIDATAQWRLPGAEPATRLVVEGDATGDRWWEIVGYEFGPDAAVTVRLRADSRPGAEHADPSEHPDLVLGQEIDVKVGGWRKDTSLGSGSSTGPMEAAAFCSTRTRKVCVSATDDWYRTSRTARTLARLLSLRLGLAVSLP